MSQPFIAEIRLFGFDFAPRGWAHCDGQTISIAQNTALFALIGVTYGGNGTTNYLLPDLRGRRPIHAGQGPGLSNYNFGQTGGVQSVALSVNQMPSHSHAVAASSAAGNSNSPVNTVFAATTGRSPPPFYNASTAPSVAMSNTALANTGTGTPHENMQPYQVANFCIAMQGVFPPRN